MDSSREGGLAPAQSTGARQSAALPKDSTDLLIEFSIALHKRAMYPLGHPHLVEAGRRLLDRLEAYIARHGAVAIGVAGHQLIMHGAASDPRSALLSDLAGKLHRHRIASVRFEPELAADELEDLLAALVADPTGPEGPLGQSEAGSIALATRSAGSDRHHPAAARWRRGSRGRVEQQYGGRTLGRARAARPVGDGASAADADDPLAVARAIDDETADAAYDQVVFNYVRQIADALNEPGSANAEIQDQASRLIASLKPETLRRILERGGDATDRRRLTEVGAQVFGLEAVLEIVKAAAATNGQTISHQMLRLLHKLAYHADTGSPAGKVEAESVLRSNVSRLISDWKLEDPNPDRYTAVLEGIVRQAPAAYRSRARGPDLRSVARGRDGPRGRLQRAEGHDRGRGDAGAGQLAQLLEILTQCPDGDGRGRRGDLASRSQARRCCGRSWPRREWTSMWSSGSRFGWGRPPPIRCWTSSSGPATVRPAHGRFASSSPSVRTWFPP